MSIPYFFVDPRHEGEAIYDGGLLNNFPVEELVRLKGDSNFVGLYLKGAEISGFGRALKLLRVFQILLNRDENRTVEEYADRTAIIDPAPIRTTQFRLSTHEKDFLIARGRAAALELLSRDGRNLATREEANQAHQKADELLAQINTAKTRRRRWWALALLIGAGSGAIVIAFGVLP